METYVVNFSENNSGGHYVLSTQDYASLVRHGFKHENRWNNTIRIMASSESVALIRAITLWESITGQDSTLCACPTCGNNFSFYIVDTLQRCADCGKYFSVLQNGYCARCYAWNE